MRCIGVVSHRADRIFTCTALIVRPTCSPGLFHVAIMILMVGVTKNPDPIATVVMQCLSCVLASFVHGWVAVLGGFALWAPALMHFVWNQVNPWLLGA
jgi:hypothetical protein